jgi:hypothetical protein
MREKSADIFAVASVVSDRAQRPVVDPSMVRFLMRN